MSRDDVPKKRPITPPPGKHKRHIVRFIVLVAIVAAAAIYALHHPPA